LNQSRLISKHHHIRDGGAFWMQSHSLRWGAYPWVGGVMSAAATDKSGESQVRKDDLFRECLQEHYEKLQILRATLGQIVARLEGFGQEVEDRITSNGYLTLVRKTFVSGIKQIPTRSGDCWCSWSRTLLVHESVRRHSSARFNPGLIIS